MFRTWMNVGVGVNDYRIFFFWWTNSLRWLNPLHCHFSYHIIRAYKMWYGTTFMIWKCIQTPITDSKNVFIIFSYLLYPLQRAPGLWMKLRIKLDTQSTINFSLYNSIKALMHNKNSSLCHLFKAVMLFYEWMLCYDVRRIVTPIAPPTNWPRPFKSMRESSAALFHSLCRD